MNERIEISSHHRTMDHEQQQRMMSSPEDGWIDKSRE